MKRDESTNRHVNIYITDFFEVFDYLEKSQFFYIKKCRRYCVI